MSREDFCHVRNRVTKLIRESKKLYLCKKFDEVKGDMRRTWSVINNVTHPNSNKKRGNIDKLIGPDGPITDSLQIANAMNNYFSNVGSNIASSFHNSPDFRTFLSDSYTESFYLSDASIGDVISYIYSLKNKKCNLDALPVKVLKYIADEIAPILCYLINLSISMYTFPDLLKMARVVPLFKGGNSSEICNYRPISVLRIFSKVLEKPRWYRPNYRKLWEFFSEFVISFHSVY